MALKLFYITDSHKFFRSGYRSNQEYSLVLASSLEPDDLNNKTLDFSAVALRLGTKRWSRENDGILSLSLNLTNPVVIKAQGPIKAQTIHTLNFNFAFKQAQKGCAVNGMNRTPVFRGVSVKKYLTNKEGPNFSLNIGLAKSRGHNTNTVVEIASQILRDPAVKNGLAATLPFLGVASGIFEIIRSFIFSDDKARIIWNPTEFSFMGGEGPVYPLKAGRYLFLSTDARSDYVEKFYRYLGGRLVALRTDGKIDELRSLEQFYLDIFAYKD